MRLLGLSFSNLNSLEGTWSIDFTHPDYRSNRLFGIIGPTGAGKTTLLDAICLALYGRTPRLKIISKSTNEILTRQTGECFAEVTFSTLKGTYRCHWSQHRARKNPAGDLQQPRHEIIDVQDNSIIENKIKDVARVVEDVTGMSFDQFTRAILLAQGSFAAFLQATPDERAPLLEQITGTEIYSTISQKVHERTASLDKLYALGIAEVDGFELLSKDEIKTFSDQLEQNSRDVQILRDNIAVLVEDLKWNETLKILSREREELEKKYEEINNQLKSIGNQRDSLNAAKKANTLLALYESIRSDQKLLENETDEHKRIHMERDHLSDKRKELSQTIHHLHTLQEQKEEELRRERELISTVKELDSKIIQENILLNDEQARLQDIKRDLHNSKRLEDELKSQYLQKQEVQKNCSAYLNKWRSDLSLAGELALIEEKFRQLNEFRLAHKETSKTSKELNSELAELDKTGEEIRSRLSTFKSNQDNLKLALEHSLQRISGIDESYPGLPLLIEQKKEEYDLYVVIQELFLRIQSTEAKYSEQNSRKQEHEISEKRLLDKEKRVKKELSSQEKIVAQLEEITILNLKIKGYEEERSLLQDGKPCPLCGSEKHPFNEEETFEITDSRDSFSLEKERLKEIEHELAQIHKDIVLTQLTYRNIKRDMADLKIQANELEETLLDKLGSAKPGRRELTLDEIIRVMSSLNEQLKKLRNVYSEKSELESQERQLREKLNHEVTVSAQGEKELAELVLRRSRTEESAHITQKRLEEMSSSISQLEKELHKKLSPYGYGDVEAMDQTVILPDLSLRQTKWEENKSLSDRTTLELENISREREQNQKLYHKISIINEDGDAKIIKRKGVVHGLQLERGKIYGDKDPIKEQQRLEMEYESIRNQLRENEKGILSATEKAVKSQEKLDALSRSIKEREKKIIEQEKDFSKKLEDAGFINEEIFKKSIWSTEEMERVEIELSEIDTNATKTVALLERKNQELTNHQAKQKKEIDPEKLSREKQEKTDQLDNLLEVKGKLQEKIDENERRSAEQSRKRKNLASLKKEMLAWQSIDELIGSANGKKFRNFAQGITFEIVVAHANSNLQKMTDRYILTRSSAHPLELDIMDNYRGGEVRSTKNLSGGECFLVSLALALGLSNMSGKNIRVDSLFLDEGFGTLDEETLETALQTLATLQHEGKMIGIISHISQLQQRLETQIQVTPKYGGHSTIKGPGITSSSPERSS